MNLQYLTTHKLELFVDACAYVLENKGIFSNFFDCKDLIPYFGENFLLQLTSTEWSREKVVRAIYLASVQLSFEVDGIMPLKERIELSNKYERVLIDLENLIWFLKANLMETSTLETHKDSIDLAHEKIIRGMADISYLITIQQLWANLSIRSEKND